MTRKDYVALAAAIRGVYDILESNADRFVICQVAQAIAAMLAADNPRFERARFIIAATGLN